MKSTAIALFKGSSLLASLLFGYSASVQLDDHDWYFWLPLYACACAVNLVQGISLTVPTLRTAAQLGLGLGLCLFIKVVVEDFNGGLAGFCSLDLSERVVREKIGSGLVVISMWLHLKALDSSTSASNKIGNKKVKKRMLKIPTFVQYGMALKVGLAYGLPFVFFVLQKGQMRFDK